MRDTQHIQQCFVQLKKNLLNKLKFKKKKSIFLEIQTMVNCGGCRVLWASTVCVLKKIASYFSGFDADNDALIIEYR